MIYDNIHSAIFIDRPNRFIANILINDQVHQCHVKNTGRCRELLIEGVKIYVQSHNNPKRKTKYSLISVFKDNRLINMDSQVPNKIVHQWLKASEFFKDIKYIKSEYTYGKSRLDFYVEAQSKKILIEVKGVTLEENNIVYFPDAPTERGIKHIRELCSATDDGYISYIIFVIQMSDVLYFTPNVLTHPEFADELKIAKDKGVHILALDTIVTENSIKINKTCKVIL